MQTFAKENGFDLLTENGEPFRVMSDEAGEMTMGTTWREVWGYPVDTYNMDMYHSIQNNRIIANWDGGLSPEWNLHGPAYYVYSRLSRHGKIIYHTAMYFGVSYTYNPHRAITGIFKLEVEGPKTGEVPQTELVLSPEEERYTGKIEWIPAAGKFQPKTAYAAVINLKAEEGFFFAVNDGDTKFLDVEVSSTADVEFKYLDLNKDGIVETLRVIAYYPLTGEPVAQDTSDMSGIGDFGGGGGGLGDIGGTDVGDGSSTGKTYSEAEALALTVIPGTNMFIEINVDELDILSLEKGQEAEVRVDAVGEEVFQGTISYIGNKAASGGNGEAAKYKVRVKVERSQKMKAGMNASATITVVNKPDVLVVPVEAIQTEDGKSIVYTALDEQGLPSAPKEVETGLSTSTQVEIVSGLEEGDTVYYFPVTGGLEGMDFGGIDF